MDYTTIAAFSTQPNGIPKDWTTSGLWGYDKYSSDAGGL
jgi:hypothetical protein